MKNERRMRERWKRMKEGKRERRRETRKNEE